VNILIVEDDELLTEYLKRTLMAEGHYVRIAYDGKTGFKKAQNGSYDVIVLDIMLPDKNGLEICEELRRLKIPTPILILSAKTDEASKVTGLNYGADDYLVKPFGDKELLARIRAVTRRPASVIQSSLQVGDLVLDPESHTVTRAGKPLQLRPKEYDLLEYMLRNPEIALSREMLLKKIWHIHSDASSNRLEVYIRQLRQKVDQPFGHKYIQTVRGVGYKLVAP